MPGCRIGDTAVIIRDDDSPDNIGRYVTVEGAAEADGFRCRYEGLCWRVRAKDPLEITEHGRGGVLRYRSTWGYHPDAWLQPIRGPKQPESVTRVADKPQPVEA